MKHNYTIYRAKNAITNESYIGATTNSIEARKEDHLYKAENSSNTYFHNMIIEFGKENFTWEILDTSDGLNDLADKEKHYIKYFNSFDEGYNSDCGGGFKKSIYQFDISSGALLNTFESLEDAGSAVNAYKTSISSACLNYSKSCKGYYWSYKNSFEYLKDERLKKVKQMSLNSEFIELYDSVSVASKATGISKTCISRYCRKEREQSGGFLWEYC